MPLYGKLSDNPAQRESNILDFWSKNAIFQETLTETEGNDKWVFYEGPPTANGRPHFGHLMARVCKDLFPRFKTMQGYHVERKGGWDTHGLPVELEVEKDLGINSKAEIEQYGVEKFIEKCKESVWKYKGEWEKLIERMGFWIDLGNPYITYEDDYIESLWWELKRIWDEGLLYKGHKVLPYCPRCGTGLSSHEVAQGYETTEDPSIFVKLPVVGEENTYFLIWTTTPWTIPSNTAVAASENFLYAKVETGGENLIMAKALLDRVIGPDYDLVQEIEGNELLGKEYKPPYPLLDDDRAYKIYDASFVSLEEGTGLVHVAPAFGEEDYQLGLEKDLPFVRPIDLEGKFTSQLPLAEGIFVKDADDKIVQDLKHRNFLLRVETYEHEYPFCWRCDTPLLYFALDSWYVETTARKKNVIDNNKKINWYPPHMRDGRFGDFLTNLKDWALSRDRYWGTPLNIWNCERCDNQVSVGSRAELVELAKNKEDARDVELHRPFIDEIKLICPQCKSEMSRVHHVIDTWFDSGSMHTAQWHYPFENEEKFQSSFPADFISEGQDQTRGWFYTLLITSTLLYDEPPFRNVVVTGYGLDAEGKAMSKSRGNVIDPWKMIDKYGADAVRWYLYSSTAPWKTRKLEEDGPQEILYKFFDTLKNTYKFFSLYADIDNFQPNQPGIEPRYTPLDLWIRSRLNKTIRDVTNALEDYDIVGSTRRIESFVDDLSNWYVRCSRDRFWSGNSTGTKFAAYETLYLSLFELTKLLAPFIPFLAEEIYENLHTDGPKSVHLCSWPQCDENEIDENLEREMEIVRKLTSLGRQARSKADVKVRQPLNKLIVDDSSIRTKLRKELVQLLREQLNVKEVEFSEQLDGYYRANVNPDFSTIGPKFGDKAQKIGDEVTTRDGDEIVQSLEDRGKYQLEVDGEPVPITKNDITVTNEPKENYVEAEEDQFRIILNTEIDDRLKEEGYVRELIRRIQQLRKDAGYQVTDRINLYFSCEGEMRRAIERHSDHLSSETLARNVDLQQWPTGDEFDISSTENVNGNEVKIGLKKTN